MVHHARRRVLFKNGGHVTVASNFTVENILSGYDHWQVELK